MSYSRPTIEKGGKHHEVPAHHAAEAHAARLVAVFEPRSATSRLAVFQEEYASAFDRADYVILSSVFARARRVIAPRPVVYASWMPPRP